MASSGGDDEKKKPKIKKKYSCLETAIIKGKQLKAVAVFYSDVQM